MKENTLKQIDYLFRSGSENNYFLPYQDKTKKETFDIKLSTAKLTQDIFIELANKGLIEHNKKCDSILNFWNNKKIDFNYRFDKFLEKNNFKIIENYYSNNLNIMITDHYDLYLFEKNDCYYIGLSISVNVNGSYHNYTNYIFFQYNSNDSYYLIENLFDDRISLEINNTLDLDTMLNFDIIDNTIDIKFIDNTKKLDIEIDTLDYYSIYDYIAFKFLSKEQKQIYKKLSYDLRVDYIESFENYDSFIYEDNENKLCEYSLELFEYIYKINNDKDIKLNSLPCLYHDDKMFICGFMVQNNEK